MLVLAGGASSGAATTTVVTLTFDNNTISQFSLGYTQALQPHGAPADVLCRSGTYPAAPRTSSRGDQLNDVGRWGNEIGGKTVDGKVNLETTTDLQTKIDEVCNDRQVAPAQTLFSPTSFAYPFAAFDATAEGIVHNCGYGNARAGGGIDRTGALYAETRPPKDFYATRPYGPSGQLTLANLEAVVNGAAAHNGGWDQVVIQKVCSRADDPTNYSTCTASSGRDRAGRPEQLPRLDPGRRPGERSARRHNHPDDGSDHAVDGHRGPEHHDRVQRVAMRVVDLQRHRDGLVGADRHRLRRREHALHAGRLPRSDAVVAGCSRAVPADQLLDGQLPLLGLRRKRRGHEAQSVQLVESPDSTAPTTTVTCNGSPCQTMNTGPVTVTLSAADNPGGWGLDKTRTRPTVPRPPPKAPSTTPFTKQDATVSFFSTDLAGNAETPQSQALRFQTIVS